jgi:hypothetical protein
MKNREINLSRSSLESNTKMEKAVLEDLDTQKDETEEIKEEKKTKDKGENKLGRFIRRFKEEWKKAPTYKKALFISIPALLILAGSLFFVYQVIYGPKTRPPKLIAIHEEFIAPNNRNENFGFENFLLKNPSVPRTEESPINGRLFTKSEMEELQERRPVAVMINNHPSARPTSNLPQADMIFETLVEGGATRMLAIFWSREPNKVGTIRSVRQYFLEWLSPFDPLFIYDGFASSSNPRLNAGGNISSYNIKSIATRGAWRVSDRAAPHNEYSSVIKAQEFGKERGWDGFPNVEFWKFKRDASMEERGERFRATMNFSNDTSYSVGWEYDMESNRYLRSVGGRPDIDLETGEQLSAKNIIIQEVKIERPADRYNRIIVNTIDSGKAIILKDGEVINGSWKKDSRTARTKYHDAEGEEVHFNRGLIWILATEQIDSKFDIIEQ